MNVDVSTLLSREEGAGPLPAQERDELLTYFNQKQRELRQARIELEHQLDSRAWVSSGAQALSEEMAAYAKKQEEVDALSRALWLLGRRGHI